MRRFGKGWIILGCWIGMGLIHGGTAWAGMVGAPEGVEELERTKFLDFLDRERFEIAAEGDWIFDKDMIVADRESEKVTFSQAFRARMGYKAWDWVELYALLGAADIELESIDTTGDRITDDYSRGFQWGGGLAVHRELSEEWWNLRVTVDGQFTGWESDIDHSTGTRSGPEVNSRGEAIIRNYHAAVVVGRAYSLDEWTFVPYLGGRWSQFTIEENDRDSDNLIVPDAAWRADDHLGVILGVSAEFGGVFELGVEGRLLDETALAVNVRYKF